MKRAKLIVGVIQIVVGVLALFYAGIAGIASYAFSTSTYAGVYGVIIGLMFVLTGIIYIRTRQSNDLTMDLFTVGLTIIALAITIFANVFQVLFVWSCVATGVSVAFYFWHRFGRVAR